MCVCMVPLTHSNNKYLRFACHFAASTLEFPHWVTKYFVYILYLHLYHTVGGVRCFVSVWLRFASRSSKRKIDRWLHVRTACFKLVLKVTFKFPPPDHLFSFVSYFLHDGVIFRKAVVFLIFIYGQRFSQLQNSGLLTLQLYV